MTLYCLRTLLLFCASATTCATCPMWSVNDSADREHIFCADVSDSVGAVCIDQSSVRPDLTMLLVRHSPAVGIVRTHYHQDACSLAANGTECNAGAFRHTLKDDFTTGPAPQATQWVGQVRVPTTLHRPGGLLGGVLFLRRQESAYSTKLALPTVGELAFVQVALLDPAGQEVAVVQWDDEEASRKYSRCADEATPSDVSAVAGIDRAVILL